MYTWFCSSNFSFTSCKNLSTSKADSGKYIKSATCLPLSLAKADDAASHPVSRPIVSTINIPLFMYTDESKYVSRTVVAINFAADPKPGVWSVYIKSLSIVFGIPINLISRPVSLAYLPSFAVVSIESFPPT